MQPGKLVRLKPDFLHYHATTVNGNDSLMIEAEDILLFIKWDLTSREDQAGGIMLLGETLVHSYMYVFEPLKECYEGWNPC